MADISLWLDDYDDLFSDFDSRNYLKRRVSEDFLEELKSALRYRTEKLDRLVFLMPEGKRKSETETDIIDGLRAQFLHRSQLFTIRYHRALRRSLVMTLGGLILMLLSSVSKAQGYWGILLHIVIDPVSWFLLWTGLDGLVYDLRTNNREALFYSAMNKMEINFQNS